MAYYFKCKLNKSALSYKCGDTIRFEVSAYNKCNKIDCDYIRWELKTDDRKAIKGLGSCTATKPLVIETTLERPGFAYLICTAHKSDSTVDAGFDKLEAGAGAEVEKLKYHDTVPQDFNDYWNGIEKLVADTTIEVLSCEENPKAKKGYKGYDIMIKTPEGRPSAFSLTVPEADGKYPLKVNFMGYGVGDAPLLYNENTITAHFSAHGIETAMLRIDLAEKYPELFAGYGFDDNDNSDKKTTYYRGMMIRDLIGVKYLKTLDKWDGKNIVSAGGSQGALQATTVAAHDKDITFLDIYIPWFCDLSAKNDGYMTGWRPNFREGLRYFDTVAQGMLVKCPVRIKAGLGDYICPPSSIMALYNSIKTLKTIRFVQAATHSYEPNEVENYYLNHDPENNEIEIKKGKYRHFKGNEYEVIDIGFDAETEEKVVIYKALYGDSNIWVRRLGEFADFVYRDNKVMKRFTYIG